jgi:hypothetical protein
MAEKVLGMILVTCLVGCSAGQTTEKVDVTPAVSASTSATMTKEKAVAIARKSAEGEYDLSKYELKTATYEASGGLAGMWRIYFEIKGKGFPGGHFTVYVNAASGQPELIPGR